MKDRTSELLEFIVDCIEYFEKESKKTYSILEEFLQESSHSFGFKTFSNAQDKFINGLDKILKNEEVSYLYYENLDRLPKKEILKELNKNKFETKDLLLLIFSIMKYLYEENHRIGKIFSLFIVDLYEDPAKHCFKPIDEVLKFMEDNLDFSIFKDLNEGSSEGWLYWFFVENEFGKRKFETSYNGVKYLIDSEESFLLFIKELEKEV